MEAGYLRSDSRHHTGRAFAGNERQRRQKPVSAADHQKIYVIDRCGMYRHQHLIRPRHGLSGLADAQSLGGPKPSTTIARIALTARRRPGAIAHRQWPELPLRDPLHQLTLQHLATCG